MRRTCLWLLAIFLVCGGLVATAEELRIVPTVHEDEVLVSVDFTDAYTPEVADVIASGLRTTVSYDVELRMHAALWLDRTIATAVVTTTDQYDNLTRRHTLTRSVDGRVQETSVTDDANIVRRWLTSLNRVPLCRTWKLEPARDYYVRIRARVRPTGTSLLGLASAAIGQARLTYIP